jgi:hypothetical protein
VRAWKRTYPIAIFREEGLARFSGTIRTPWSAWMPPGRVMNSAA